MNKYLKDKMNIVPGLLNGSNEAAKRIFKDNGQASSSKPNPTFVESECSYSDQPPTAERK